MRGLKGSTGEAGPPGPVGERGPPGLQGWFHCTAPVTTFVCVVGLRGYPGEIGANRTVSGESSL